MDEGLTKEAGESQERLRLLAAARRGDGAAFRTAYAMNGRSALEMMDELKPDLIILDLMMPEMNGPDVIAALRRIRPWMWRRWPCSAASSKNICKKAAWRSSLVTRK